MKGKVVKRTSLKSGDIRTSNIDRDVGSRLTPLEKESLFISARASAHDFYHHDHRPDIDNDYDNDIRRQ